MNVELSEGDLNSRTILHVPHSSRFIPGEERADILLGDQELEVELDEMTDTDTDQIAFEAARLAEVKPWIFRNTYSRLVIDPERFPDDREAMNQVGMGAVYHRTSQGAILRNADKARDNRLITKYFYPYAQAFENLTSQILERKGSVTIIDVHSYRVAEHPNGINKGQRRPEICLGVDEFHTPAWLEGSALTAFSSAGEVVVNEPYSGSYVPLKFYGENLKVRSVMMENREDNFTGERFALTCRALANLINMVESESDVH